MRLAAFIRANIEPILQKWEEFAVTILPGRKMDKAALRDHAREMLLTVAADLDRSQTEDERSEKSKGRGPQHAEMTAAEAHGAIRWEAGFNVNETLSEYRALRASVIAFWTKASAVLLPSDIDDLIRFNKAIDQALAESLASYTSQKEMQTRLFETILSTSPDHAFILDRNGRFMYANKALREMYGMRLGEIVGKTFFDLGFPFSAEIQLHLQHVIKTKEIYRGELTYSFASGKGGKYEYIVAPALDESGKVDAIAGTARDITERKAAEEESWTSANFDLLTGLPNRRLFRDRLEQDVKHAERTGLPMAVMFLDLDRFKEVNDLLGHDAGDILLRQAAERIISCVRRTDTVARLGGDEFTVILTEVNDVKHVEVLAREIVEELARPFHILHDVVHISGSIGITLFPQDAITSKDLVRNADQAMYVAKTAGRNGLHFFTPTIQETALSRLRLIGDLREALPKQQLAVYYQAIVDLSDGRIIKAEALLRWQHPQRGLVLPGEFIGLAEETGFINEIGNWVFAQAALRSKQWSALLGTPFQVAINKSPLEFMANASETNWEAHLEALGLARHCMSVEITESVLLNASAVTIEKLSNLQKAGIDLAIDDFGTGYSSMAYLKKFDVDDLKIDKSVVQATTTDANSRTIAETIIVMAHKLGLKVVGEGVETVEQRDWLRAAGCDYAQGYLFSEAIPPEEFGKFLKREQAKRLSIS
jgi:diguanylate cyclase (GGDEF)-like protein/PAS domain S-box-containing protein